MSEQIMINEQELVNFIEEKATDQGVKLSKEDIATVLDLEFEFLKLKGVVEELGEEGDELTIEGEVHLPSYEERFKKFEKELERLEKIIDLKITDDAKGRNITINQHVNTSADSKELAEKLFKAVKELEVK